MKLVGLQIFRWDAEKPVILSQHLDLSQFSFFQRGTIKEHMVFHSRLICSRTGKGMRQSIEFEQKLGMCHIYVHQCGLAVTVLCDMEYPMRVAFSLINQILRAFQEKLAGTWEHRTEDIQLDFQKEGDEMLVKYQNPLEADKLLKVQSDLDEVKDVMLKNIDELLQRGEKLENLMERSEDLSQTSHQFYRTAKKNNQCCSWY
eukprot:GHVU01147605.1.p1 GENE.GHVU01147605.1~~GHVU01147605.1.p1  ORF type:complete len:202 (-),score=24.56 GHVU01147605.1:665-1270(-)